MSEGRREAAEEKEEEEGGYRTKNKNPTRQCGEKRHAGVLVTKLPTPKIKYEQGKCSHSRVTQFFGSFSSSFMEQHETFPAHRIQNHLRQLVRARLSKPRDVDHFSLLDAYLRHEMGYEMCGMITGLKYRAKWLLIA